MSFKKTLINTKRGDSLLAVEARIESMKMKFHYCLVNNLGEIMASFLKFSCLQAGVLSACQNSALVEFLSWPYALRKTNQQSIVATDLARNGL